MSRLTFAPGVGKIAPGSFLARLVVVREDHETEAAAEARHGEDDDGGDEEPNESVLGAQKQDR